MSRILDAKRDMDTIKGLRSEIARLQEQVETLTKERDGLIKAVADHVTVRGEYFARAEAAEAERDRLREALVEIAARPGRMTWGEDSEYRQVAREMEDIAEAALQKEPQP